MIWWAKFEKVILRGRKQDLCICWLTVMIVCHGNDCLFRLLVSLWNRSHCYPNPVEIFGLMVFHLVWHQNELVERESRIVSEAPYSLVPPLLIRDASDNKRSSWLPKSLLIIRADVDSHESSWFPGPLLILREDFEYIEEPGELPIVREPSTHEENSSQNPNTGLMIFKIERTQKWRRRSHVQPFTSNANFLR